MRSASFPLSQLRTCIRGHQHAVITSCTSLARATPTSTISTSLFSRKTRSQVSSSPTTNSPSSSMEATMNAGVSSSCTRERPTRSSKRHNEDATVSTSSTWKPRPSTHTLTTLKESMKRFWLSIRTPTSSSRSSQPTTVLRSGTASCPSL